MMSVAATFEMRKEVGVQDPSELGMIQEGNSSICIGDGESRVLGRNVSHLLTTDSVLHIS